MVCLQTAPGRRALRARERADDSNGEWTRSNLPHRSLRLPAGASADHQCPHRGGGMSPAAPMQRGGCACVIGRNRRDGSHRGKGATAVRGSSLCRQLSLSQAVVRCGCRWLEMAHPATWTGVAAGHAADLRTLRSPHDWRQTMRGAAV